MRIAVVNGNNRKAGGIEKYLECLLPELQRRDQSIFFLAEHNHPMDRKPIALPETVPSWCVSEHGFEGTLAALRAWKPDLIYAHGSLSVELETALLGIAAGTYFAHNYYGTCISGLKTFSFPALVPCERRFGWKCMAHYFPHRCGGWSPVTMIKEYQRQSGRLQSLAQYRSIVTHSRHMQREYIRNGFAPDRVHQIPFAVAELNSEPMSNEELLTIAPARAVADASALRLLFLGRMESLKGGEILLEALPLAQNWLRRPIYAVFAGDGSERQKWEREARLLQERCPAIKIEFSGWVDQSQMSSLLAGMDLLVMPSVWPEPFGMVGPEVGLHGIPVAAFAVGGIPDWLENGVNGYLAPGDPPTAAGLASAILRCLRDPAEHARLGQGARRSAERFRMDAHVSALLEILEQAAGCNGSGSSL